MLLALDIGNSNITIGVYLEQQLLFTSRMATDRTKMEDQYAVELRNILEMYNVKISEIHGTIISSVVPSLTNFIKRAVVRLTGIVPICVGTETAMDLEIAIKHPETFGADLILGCVAAAEMYGCPCIILDLGTATTICVMDENKRALGGSIIPGVGISLNALTSRVPQLPSITLEAPERVIADNTADCMRSGIIYGTACMIDGLCGRIEEELGTICKVVATGGLAQEIVENCKREVIFCDNLLLEGLRILYEKNNGSK